MKSLKSFPQVHATQNLTSISFDNEKNKFKPNYIDSLGTSKSHFNTYNNIELIRRIDDNQHCLAIPKISDNKVNDKVSSRFNIHTNTKPNSSLFQNEYSSMKTFGDSTEASNTQTLTKSSIPELSKRWTKISNLIKAVKFLHMYDTVSIKENGDIEHNLEDYRNRLLTNSPIKRCKTKNKQHIKMNTNFKTKETIIPQFSLAELNFRTLSNTNLLTDRCNLLDASVPIKKRTVSQVEKQKVLNSEKMKLDLAHVHSLNRNEDSSYSAVSNKSSSEQIDEVHVEMNKISVIERIKDYILE